VLNGGGFNGNVSYDGSVYYAAADALTFGRMPYRDFVMLHPPGIMVVLSPFALIGRLTTDHTGFVLAMLATMALGGLNAALVVRIGQRLGLGTLPATLGGLFYAIWGSSVLAEYVVRLEPVGNTFLLLGLLLCLPLDGVPTRRSSLRAATGGAALAAAASVKIWWALPLVLVIAWIVVSHRRYLRAVILGALACLLVLNGPFFAIAPRQMFSMIVLDQFGRARSGTIISRATQMLGLGGSATHLGSATTRLFVIAAVLGVTVALARALRIPAVRPIAAIAVAQLIVLFASPSWYPYYADFLTPALALSVAGAAQARTAPATIVPRHYRWGAAVAIGCSLALTAGATTYFFVVGPHRVTIAFPSAQVASMLRGDRCVMSDSPMGPILIDTLSHDLARGCPNWIDVTGRTFGVDAWRNREGLESPRTQDPRWQRDLLRYLSSGQAALIVRQPITGLTRHSLFLLRQGGVLSRGHGYAVYATPSPILSTPTPSRPRRLPLLRA
jgi:hypothetical protein